MIELKLSAHFGRFTGGELCFSIDDGLLREAVEPLLFQYPGLRTVLLTDTGDFRGTLTVNIDGRYCRHDELSLKKLKNSTVEVYPVLTGG